MTNHYISPILSSMKLLENSLTIASLEIICVLILTFIITSIISNFADKLSKSLSADILKNITKPIKILIWILGIIYAAEILNSNLHFTDTKTLSQIRIIILILTAGWIAFDSIDTLEEHLLHKKISKIDKTTAGAIAKILKIIAVLIIGMMLVEALGFSIAGVIAFAGGGGVAVGFASKDLMANFFGALMIYLDKPFKVGDWIKIPEKHIEGIVDTISLRSTIIKDDGKNPIHVPNSVFTSVLIENHSRINARKFSSSVQIRHEDIGNISKIQSAIQIMLETHPLIDNQSSIIVGISSYTTSGIKISISAFINEVTTDKFLYARHVILVEIGKIIKSNKAQFAKTDEPQH